MSVFITLYKPSEEQVPWWLVSFLRQLLEQGVDWIKYSNEGSEMCYPEDILGAMEVDEEDPVEMGEERNFTCPECKNAEGIGNRRMECDVCNGDFLEFAKTWLSNHEGQVLSISW